MPVYEYYCPTCEGRFSHLVREYDAPPPPCPRCGTDQVEKLISRVSVARSDQARQADYRARSRDVDPGDAREVARFLQQAGSVAEEAAPIEGDAFREIVARRAEGARDEDLQDVVDEIPLSQQVFTPDGPRADHAHDHPCGEARCHDGEQGSSSGGGRLGAEDLGWA